MPYFRIVIGGEKPKQWEREFEVEGHTSALALVSLFVHLGALSQEKALHRVHIGAPYDKPTRKSAWGIVEFRTNKRGERHGVETDPHGPAP
jgi:hypothetical protein